MSRRNAPGPGDRLFTAIAYGLAAASVTFAGTMIVGRESARVPHALARTAASTADPEALRADPVTTGSISRSATGFGHPLVPRISNRGPEAPGYRVLSVSDGTALIAFTDSTGSHILTIRTGGLIPGAGRVLGMSAADHQRKVFTDRMILSSEVQ